MKNKIKVPLRLSLAGGGTDVEPYASQFGSEILNFTINRFVCAEISKSRIHDFSISINDNYQSVFPQKITSAIKNWCIEENISIPKNIQLALQTPVRPGSGLGASSAMVVAAISILNDFLSLGLQKKEIALHALNLERNFMKIEGGFQDQFSAAYTGFNLIHFFKGQFEVNSLKLSEHFLKVFNSSLLVLDLGIDRKGEDIIRDQTRRVITEKSKTIDAMHAQRKIVPQMMLALEQEDIEELGTLLDQAWIIKRKFSPRISTREIDLLHELLISNGAYGMKVSGAGGGGHVFALIRPEARESLISTIENAGITRLDASIFGGN